MERVKFVLSVAIVSIFINASMAIGGAYIGSGDIIDGGVHENDIGKMAVTKTKIKTGAVNKYKIASGAVNQYKIANGAVTPAKLSQPYSGISHNHGTSNDGHVHPYANVSHSHSYANSSHSHNYSSPGHTHDSRYYTVAEMNAFMDEIWLGIYLANAGVLSTSERAKMEAKIEAMKRD